jgi:hypothetical protein
MMILALLLNLGLAANAADSITPAQAKDFVGKKATVCGVVASATFIEKGKDQPTLLNLDQAYPKQIFTVVILGKDRKKFGGQPEKDLAKKKLCATGDVTAFKNLPQIVVSDPKQIAVADEKPAKKAAPAAK